MTAIRPRSTLNDRKPWARLYKADPRGADQPDVRTCRRAQHGPARLGPYVVRPWPGTSRSDHGGGSGRHVRGYSVRPPNPEAKITSSMKTRKSTPYAGAIAERQRTGLRVFGALEVARSAGLGGAGGPARAEHGRAFFGFAQNRLRPAPLRFIFASGLTLSNLPTLPCDVSTVRLLGLVMGLAVVARGMEPSVVAIMGLSATPTPRGLDPRAPGAAGDPNRTWRRRRNGLVERRRDCFP
jgi:hypothetical protein